MNQDYVCLEASLAESICAYFYRKHGYMVQPFGIETIVGNAFYFLDVKNHEDTKKKAMPIIHRCMTMPDFLVIKPSKNNGIQETYLVEAKYRTYKDYKEFQQAYIKDGDGELKKTATKYLNLWGTLYMFIIVKFAYNNSVHIYYDTAQNISDGYLHGLDYVDSTRKWINKEIREEIVAQCQKIFG